MSTHYEQHFFFCRWGNFYAGLPCQYRGSFMQDCSLNTYFIWNENINVRMLTVSLKKTKYAYLRMTANDLEMCVYYISSGNHTCSKRWTWTCALCVCMTGLLYFAFYNSLMYVIKNVSDLDIVFIIISGSHMIGSWRELRQIVLMIVINRA